MNHGIADDVGKLILRLTLAVLVLFHGVAKITSGIGPIEGMVTGAGLPSFVAYGVYLGEILGPILVLVGNMLFALVLAHRDDLMALSPHGGWALELQGFFLLTALAVVFLGPGRASMNNR